MAELEKDARPRRQLATPAAAALVKQTELPPPASPARHPPTAEPEAPNSATRRRRAQAAHSPSARESATAVATSGGGGNSGAFSSVVTAMGDADVSARTQARKVLGRYTARECALLCETILAQLKRHSTAPGVLEDALSPAHIRWEKIAVEMRQEHRLAISPRDAQALWKFLAYGKQPRAKTSGGDDELLAASDSEDLGLSAQSINAKTRAAAAAPPDSAKAATDPAPPGAAAAQLRLYPSYELPLGLPETWQKPFNVKATLPLTFVAEKLLKDKPGAPPALLAAAGGVTGALTAMSPGTNGAAAANGAPVIEKKRGRKPGPKPKTLADVEAAKKQRVMAQPKPPAVAAGTPRAAYTPSPTPPAQPVLPRSAFQFFCRMYEVNPKIVEAQATPVAAAAPATAGPAGAPVKTAAAATSAAVPAKKTYSELQALFSGSPLYVRSQCQKYALEDLDRYNHECLPMLHPRRLQLQT